jgi:hypothetical protein
MIWEPLPTPGSPIAHSLPLTRPKRKSITIVTPLAEELTARSTFRSRRPGFHTLAPVGPQILLQQAHLNGREMPTPCSKPAWPGSKMHMHDRGVDMAVAASSRCTRPTYTDLAHRAGARPKPARPGSGIPSVHTPGRGHLPLPTAHHRSDLPSATPQPKPIRPRSGLNQASTTPPPHHMIPRRRQPAVAAAATAADH